jgi:limonene-1,2-epoxide hydrolase
MTDTGATGQATAEVAVVRDFLAALERLDVDAVLALADDAIVYQNVPLPPARGREAFEKQVRWMAKELTGFEARIVNIAGNGPIVLTERVDVLARGRFRTEFWACGTFEVRGGKVVVWRDRFDYADVTVASLKGAARALVGAVAARRSG